MRRTTPTLPSRLRTTLLRGVIPVMMAAASPAVALDLDAMTEEERAAFRAEVRAYLMENPEVLMEAIGVLEAREEAAEAASDRAMAAANLDALHSPDGAWIGGNPDGDITIVEFMDYRCGFCRRAFPEVEELVATDGNIRLILREFPILGEQSTLASRFAIATQLVHGDAAYKDLHDGLMTLRSDVSEPALIQLAEALGLDAEPILAELGSDAVSEVVDRNRALAQALRISGTPTFIVEDQMLRGYLPLQQMEIVVDQIRAEG